uniref:Uncharacterized protein n=1 Tax=Cacopsylla melanoneura TaxID=428564 RepID=A0A8D9AHA4_9HEMI
MQRKNAKRKNEKMQSENLCGVNSHWEYCTIRRVSIVDRFTPQRSNLHVEVVETSHMYKTCAIPTNKVYLCGVHIEPFQYTSRRLVIWETPLRMRSNMTWDKV